PGDPGRPRRPDSMATPTGLAGLRPCKSPSRIRPEMVHSSSSIPPRPRPIRLAGGPNFPRLPTMIIVLKPHPTLEQVQHVLDPIAALGLTPHLSQGVARTIIGVIGDEEKLQAEPLSAIDGVESVLPILKPFKLASREFHEADTVVEVKGVRI